MNRLIAREIKYPEPFVRALFEVHAARDTAKPPTEPDQPAREEANVIAFPWSRNH